MYFKFSGCRVSERMLDIPVTQFSVLNVRHSDMICLIVRGMPQLAQMEELSSIFIKY